MIEVGKRQTLLVDSEDNSGFYLFCDDRTEVFMPGTLAPDGLKVDDNVEVFVFIDSKGDKLATGTMPIAEVGDLVCLKVKDMTRFGAFLDIGLPKDLLVPKNLQKYEMKVGDVHLVKILKDEETEQLLGTEKIEPYIEREFIDLIIRQTVKIVPFHKTPLGYKVLIDKKYLGMIYHNEIFSGIVVGNEYEGSVKTVREDGQVDVVLGKMGFDSVKGSSAVILEALKKAGGRLDLWDKSSPEEIRQKLSMSKKSFKAAVGILYKKRLIKISEGYIELV